jgi:hypothetical protein
MPAGSNGSATEHVTLVSVEAAVVSALNSGRGDPPNLTATEMQQLAQKVYDLLRADLRIDRERR